MAQKWRKCPHLGISFSGHNSAIFVPIGRTFFMDAKETKLHIDEKSNLCLFFNSEFWATIGRKMSVATTCTPFGLGPPIATKKLTHCWVLNFTTLLY